MTIISIQHHADYMEIVMDLYCSNCLRVNPDEVKDYVLKTLTESGINYSMVRAKVLEKTINVIVTNYVIGKLFHVSVECGISYHNNPITGEREMNYGSMFSYYYGAK